MSAASPFSGAWSQRNRIEMVAETTVSIVMPCYNAALHLAGSVASVQAQTRPDWELIIVDDGSTDESWQELRSLAAADTRLKIFQQPNSGAAAARNRALNEARGRYIAFLDADDTWHPEFLARMLDALTTRTDTGLAYCGWQTIGRGTDRDAPFVPPDYENGNKIEALLEGCRWPIHGALTPSKLVREAHGFDETLSSCMDFDLWLRIGAVHRLVRVPHVLAYYHHHGGDQITRNRARIALNHWRVQQKYLRAHPSVVQALGKEKIDRLTLGELLKRGYACYWQRDLAAARAIFRTVMKQGYGTRSDWKYMLPAWLPAAVHERLIGLRDRNAPTADGKL